MTGTFNPGDLWVLVWIAGAALLYLPLEAARRWGVRKWDHRKRKAEHRA